MTHSNPSRRLALALGAAAFVLAAATPALARNELLRWTHPNPNGVQGFRVHYGPSSRQYTKSVDVGLPQPDAAGVYVYDLVVPNAATIYVSVTAYGPSQLQSSFSNEQLRPPPVAGPPPGSGSGGSGGSGSGGGGSSGGDTGGGSTGGGTGGGGTGGSEIPLGAPGQPKLVTP